LLKRCEPTIRGTGAAKIVFGTPRMVSGRGGFFKADDNRKHSNRSGKNQLWDIRHYFLLREWVNKTMLCHQQQDDFLLSTTRRRLDYITAKFHHAFLSHNAEPIEDP
jgi:hypothetical protein